MKTVNVPALQLTKHLSAPAYAALGGGVGPVYRWYVSGWDEQKSRFEHLATFYNEDDANLFIMAKEAQ